MSQDDRASRADVFAAIAREREHQIGKRGMHRLDVGAWLTVMRCELAEAEMAWVKGHPEDADALCEILQVVSVGVACLEQHGIVERRQV